MTQMISTEPVKSSYVEFDENDEIFKIVADSGNYDKESYL